MWNRLLKLCLIGYTGCVFYAYTMEEGSDLQKKTKELISNQGTELLPGVLPLPLTLKESKKGIPRLRLPLRNKKLVRISSTIDIRLISPRSPKGGFNTPERLGRKHKNSETFLGSKEEKVDSIVNAVCAGLPGDALCLYRMDWKDHRLSQLIKEDKEIYEKANIMENILLGMNEVQRRNAIYACLVAASVYGENKMLQVSMVHWAEIEGKRIEEVAVRQGVLSCLFSIICDKGLDFPEHYAQAAHFLVEHANLDLQAIKMNKGNRPFMPFIENYVESARAGLHALSTTSLEEEDGFEEEGITLKRRRSISLRKKTLNKSVIRKRSKSFDGPPIIDKDAPDFLQLKKRK